MKMFTLDKETKALERSHERALEGSREKNLDKSRGKALEKSREEALKSLRALEMSRDLEVYITDAHDQGLGKPPFLWKLKN